MIWIIDVLVPLSPYLWPSRPSHVIFHTKTSNLPVGIRGEVISFEKLPIVLLSCVLLCIQLLILSRKWQYIRRSVTFTIVQKTIKETLFCVSGAGIHYSIITTTDNSITSPIMVGGNLICFNHTPDLIGWCIHTHLTYHPEAVLYLATYLRDISPVYRPNLA